MKRKAIHTLRNLRKTACYYYGNNWKSLFRFLYYSLLSRHNFVVYSLNLSEDLPEYFLAEGMKVIRPARMELDNLRRCLDLPREFYYDEIHGVERCYVAMKGDELAYIHWVYIKGNPSRFLRLSEGVAEVNYATTLQNFRGRGLMREMMAYTARSLKREGFRQVVAVIHEENGPACRSMENAGWQEIAQIRTLGYFNGKITV